MYVVSVSMVHSTSNMGKLFTFFSTISLQNGQRVQLFLFANCRAWIEFSRSFLRRLFSPPGRFHLGPRLSSSLSLHVIPIFIRPVCEKRDVKNNKECDGIPTRMPRCFTAETYASGTIEAFCIYVMVVLIIFPFWKKLKRCVAIRIWTITLYLGMMMMTLLSIE